MPSIDDDLYTPAGAVAATSDNPDKAADALNLSKVTGAPAPTIYDDLDNFKTTVKQQSAGAIAQANPEIARLTSDPMHAKVSNDDLHNLDALSTPLHALGAPSVWQRIKQASDNIDDAVRQGYDYQGQKEEFSQLYNYVPGSKPWQYLVAATAPLSIGLNAGLHLFSAAQEGATTAVSEAYKAFGGDEYQAAALKRDLNVAAQVSFAPEAHGVHGNMMRQARAAREIAQPFLDEGRPPPTGVDPHIDAGHAAQNAADLTQLKQALAQAQESTTRERAPAVFKQYVQQHVGDETIGLNHDAVRQLYGTEVPDPADGKLGFIPDLPAQMLRSAVTGQDIQVPKADWITHADPAVAQGLEPFIRMRPEGVTAFEAEALAQRDAYHGSPRDLTAFDDSKIGSGFGATNQGHGFYLSNDKEFARNFSGGLDYEDPETLATMLEQHLGSRENALAQAREAASGDPKYKAVVEALESGRELSTKEGGLYNVRINRDDAHFIDQDKTLGQQTPYVQERIKQLYGELPAETRGVDLVPMDAESASKAHAAGIAGSTYESGKNIVVLRHDDLQITHKNDIAVQALREQAGLADRSGPIAEAGAFRHYDVPDPSKIEYRRAGHGGDEILMRRDTVEGGKKIDTYTNVGEAQSTVSTIDDLRKIVGKLPPLEQAAAEIAPAVLDHLGLGEVPTYTVPGDHPAVHGMLGAYYPSSDAIVLRHTGSDRQMLTTMVHETYHAAFMRAIDSVPGVKDAVQHLMDIVQANSVDGENHYGLTSPHEFVSEAFARPQFQEKLAQTKLTTEQLGQFHALLGEETSSIKSLWDAFTQLARKIFGLKPTDVTALDAAFRVGDRLTAAAEAERPAAQEGVDFQAQPLAQRDPVFDHAAALGMTPRQLARYRDLIAKQRAEEADARNAKILADERRRQTAEWKTNETAMRKQVAQEYPRQPDVLADGMLRDGQRLDTDMLSVEQRAALGDSHTRGGLNPDDLARLTGFESGDEMVSAVAKLREQRGEARPIEFARAQVAAETARRMEAQYGKLDENVVEAAKDRVLSQTQMDMLHLDAEASGLPVSKEALRENVRAVVGSMPLSTINSDASIAAAGRAGRALEDALLKGDAKEAFAQRMRQYNHLLAAKEMVKIEKAQARFAKTMKTYSAREVAGASQEYVNQLHGLMQRLGQPVKRSVQDIAESQVKDGHGSFADFVASKEGLDGDPRFRQDLHVPDWLRDPSFNTKLSDLTADQFGQLDRAVKALVHNARNDSKVIRAGEKIEFVQARDDLIEQLKAVLPENRKPLKLDNPHEAGKVAKAYWWSSINLETMFNRFDRDDPLGVFNQTLVRSYTEAAGDRERMLIDYNRKVRGLGDFGNMDKLVKNDLFRDPETGQPYEMKRRHVLGVLQNVGNASNMRKLTEGYGISPAEVMDFLHRNTTKEDWDRAQAIGDLFGELFEKADNMSHNVSGVGIEKLPLSEVASPHGDTYPGWYNPVAYDKLRGEKTGKRGSIDDLEGGFYKATTPQGYTKSRTGYIGQMQLNLDIVPARMKQMIHDITTREAVMQLGKFFYDPKFKNAIRDHYGAAQAEALEPFLRDFANAPNFESYAARQQDRLIGAMSSNMVTTAIGLNPGTVLKHGLGALGKSLLQQPIGFTKALATLLSHDEEAGASNWTRALELSDECKRRMRNFEDTVTNAGQTISLKGAEGSHWKSVRAFSQYISGWPIGAFDMLSSVPTFLASYDRAIAEGHDVGQAQFLANRDVRTTHGSSLLTNRPEIARSRSAMARTFSGFYGVFSENLQKQYQTAWMLKDTYRYATEGDYAEAVKNLPKLAGVAFTSTLMMALVEHAVDSDDKSKKESWAQYASDLLTKSATSSLIGIRDLANSLTSDRDPGGNLLSGFEKTIVDPLKDVRRAVLKGNPAELWGPAKAGAFLKRVATMTAALTGMGNAQLGRMAQFMYNIKRENPRGIGDLVTGLWHGTLKNHRKGIMQ